MAKPRALPTDQVGDQVARLLAALEDGAKAAIILMSEIGLTHRPSFRKNYLHPAMASGLVEMTRPEAPRAKNQKYRLTRRGRDALLDISGSIRGRARLPSEVARAHPGGRRDADESASDRKSFAIAGPAASSSCLKKTKASFHPWRRIRFIHRSSSSRV